VDAIGRTPLVDLARPTRARPGRLLAQLEYLNPAFSQKDRIAKQIIEDAEAEGTLAPGQTVVELKSGKTVVTLIHDSGLYLSTDLFE
jgi:cysteine synthase A